MRICHKDTFYVKSGIFKSQDFAISGTALVCYECHDVGCGEHEYGVGVSCQTEDPEAEHYGDFCYVAHTGRWLNYEK